MKLSGFSFCLTMVSSLAFVGQSFAADAPVSTDEASTASAPAATKRDRSFLTRSSDVKGYGKRDRLLPSSTMGQLPSQLHEVYGPRIEIGGEFASKKVKQPVGEDRARSIIQGPTATARVSTSGDILAVSLGGQYVETVEKDKNLTQGSEKINNSKFLPAVAVSVSDNFTLGINSDFNWVKARSGDLEFADKLYYHRETASFSYHTSKFEVGAGYTNRSFGTFNHDDQGKATLALNSGRGSATGFSLNAKDTEERQFYVAPQQTVFGRANLTSNFSMMTSLTHAQYDANRSEANPVFTTYRNGDRFAAQLQTSYWFNDQASRISLTGKYRGAAVSPIGFEENGFGYGLVNTYGGTVDGQAQVANRVYLGLLVGYARGERNNEVVLAGNDTRIAATEEQSRIATSVGMNF